MPYIAYILPRCQHDADGKMVLHPAYTRSRRLACSSVRGSYSMLCFNIVESTELPRVKNAKDWSGRCRQVEHYLYVDRHILMFQNVRLSGSWKLALVCVPRRLHVIWRSLFMFCQNGLKPLWLLRLFSSSYLGLVVAFVHHGRSCDGKREPLMANQVLRIALACLHGRDQRKMAS